MDGEYKRKKSYGKRGTRWSEEDLRKSGGGQPLRRQAPDIIGIQRAHFVTRGKAGVISKEDLRGETRVIDYSKYDIFIGIDPGEHTGIAIWNKRIKKIMGMFETDFWGCVKTVEEYQRSWKNGGREQERSPLRTQKKAKLHEEKLTGKQSYKTDCKDIPFKKACNIGVIEDNIGLYDEHGKPISVKEFEKQIRQKRKKKSTKEPEFIKVEYSREIITDVAPPKEVVENMIKTLNGESIFNKVLVRIEDPNLNKPVFISQKQGVKGFNPWLRVAQNVGMNKAQARMLIDYFKQNDIDYEAVKPVSTKWTAEDLKRNTGITERTNEHVRDAVRMVWGM